MIFWIRWFFTIIAAFIISGSSQSNAKDSELYKSSLDFTYTLLPFDLDFRLSMAHETTFAVLELARIDWLIRTGFLQQGFKKGLSFAIAGCSWQFRRSVPATALQVRVKTQFIATDEKFFILEQTMFDRKGRFIGKGLMRMAAIGKGVVSGDALIQKFFGETEAATWRGTSSKDIVKTFAAHDEYLKESKQSS